MSNLESIVTRLRNEGICEVAVIDDVFDGPKEIDVSEKLDGFFPQVEREGDEEALHYLNEHLSVTSAGDVSVATAQALWDDREILPSGLKAHMERLLSRFIERRRDVETICQHLYALELDVQPYGNPEMDVERLPKSAQLVFLDYSLTPGEGRVSEASEWCARELCDREKDRPFLVLFSDDPRAPEREARFREETQRLSGTFAFVRKEVARDQAALCLHLATWGVGHPARRCIQDFIDAVTLSINETTDTFTQALRDLTVQDYSVIQRICLEAEGQPLGEYMLELFSGLLSHEFQKNSQIQETRQALDRVVFDQLIVSSMSARPQLARMYRMALTEPVLGDVGLHPHELVADPAVVHGKIAERAYERWLAAGCPSGRDKEHWRAAEREVRAKTGPCPLLALGDIFTKEAQDHLWVVVSAGCDLMFSPRATRRVEPDQPVYVMRGTFSDLRSPSHPPDKEVTEMFEFQGMVFRILWDIDHVRSIPLAIFQLEMADAGYRRTARLTLPYALRLQRAWTSHTDRVGLPAPPPMFEEVDVSVFVKNGVSDWVRCGATVRGGAVIVRRKQSKAYEEFAFLTLEGAGAIDLGLDSALQQAIRALEAAEGNARLRLESICSRLEKCKSESDWKLSLLEEPSVTQPGGSRWVVQNLVVMYYAPLANDQFSNQASVVIRIERNSVT